MNITETTKSPLIQKAQKYYKKFYKMYDTTTLVEMVGDLQEKPQKYHQMDRSSLINALIQEDTKSFTIMDNEALIKEIKIIKESLKF